MEVLGMANVMQMVIESLNLLLQMILSLGLLPLSKEIVTLSLTNLAMQKPRLTSFFWGSEIKVIPSEECVPQHKLLICELRLRTPKPHPKPFSPKLCYWKLKEPTVQEEYERVFKSKVNVFNNVEASTEETWNQLKTALLDTTNETCGETKKQHHKRETWLWNDEVNSAIAEKRRCWKGWKQGGGKEQYLQAKRTVYTAKKSAEEKEFSDLKPGMDNIFKIAKQLRKDNQDVVGDKCVKDDLGNLSFDNEAKKVAWKQHYERLLDEEFSWNPEDLTADADPVVGPPIHIDVEMVVKAISPG